MLPRFSFCGLRVLIFSQGAVGFLESHDGLHALEADHEAAEEYPVRGGRRRKLVIIHSDHSGLV